MAHSKLSPSASKRWMNCPGSIRFSEQFPRPKSSVYADEGTAAHALAEFCLKQRKDPFEFLGRKMNGHKFSVTEDMATAVKAYVDYIKDLVKKLVDEDKRVQVFFERKLNLSWIHKDMPLGTSDCVIIADKDIYVIDYKHGAGVAVDVEENSQAMIYGLGAAHELEYENMILVIIQPRCEHEGGRIREWRTDHLRMAAFEAEVKAACLETENPNAEFAASPEWCKWCPCSGGCKKQKEVALKGAQVDFQSLKPIPAEALTTDQIELVLKNEEMLSSWLKSVKERAVNLLLQGEKLEGLKLVQTWGHRKWKNPEEIEKALVNFAVDPYEKSLKTPPNIEKEIKALKVLDKKALDSLMKDLTFKPDNGPALANVTDKRETYIRPQEVFTNLSFLD